jgi:dipeptidyl aminopeptidase/acylaminoacyl peptidase
VKVTTRVIGSKYLYSEFQSGEVKMKKLILLIAYIVAIHSNFALGQQATSQVPLEHFFKDPDIVNVALSPSGQKIAITTNRGGERIGLFVYDMTGQGSMQRVAQFSSVDISSFNWVGNDRLLFSVMDYSGGLGRPDGAWGLYSVKATGQDIKELVNRRAPMVVDSNRNSKSLDWNHVLLNVPLSKENTTNWIFDQSGNPRVAFTQEGANVKALWKKDKDSEWTPLVDGSIRGLPFTPISVDESGTLYVTRSEGKEGYRVLTKYNQESKTADVKTIIKTPGFDFQGGLFHDGNNGNSLGIRVVTDAETSIWFTEERRQFQAMVDKQFSGKINRISCVKCSTEDEVALVFSYSDVDPGSYWIYRAKPETDKPKFLLIGKIRAQVDPRKMASLDIHRIKARDGREIPVWLTTPNGAVQGKPLPTVVLVHGGPWVRGVTWRWNPLTQFLASRGYLVIEPEFRGSAGYGRDHEKAGYKQYGQAMQNDVADALIWAQSKGLASNKSCIAGASYGGYSTFMGLIRNPELFSCGIAWVALADLNLYIQGSSWITDDISETARNASLPEMVGDVEKDSEMLAANSPILNASKLKAPLLMAYGEADLRVPLAHGERMRDALIKAGNPPEWVVYYGEGHGWALQKTKLDFYGRMEKLLKKSLLSP